MSGEINCKGRALSRRAVHPDISITLFNDAVHRRKSQSCTLASFLGSEEWLKDMGKDAGVHTRTRIGHRQKHVAPSLGTRMRARIPLVKLRIAGLDFQFPARGHSVTRVYSQVH